MPDAENVRREAGDLQSLAASLRQYGVLQPLGVIPLDDSSPAGAGRYRVVYGNRRRAAAILAGLPAVPCLPLPQQDGPDPLVAQLLENMQRRDLNDMEKAEGLARLRASWPRGAMRTSATGASRGPNPGPTSPGGPGGRPWTSAWAPWWAWRPAPCAATWPCGASPRPCATCWPRSA